MVTHGHYTGKLVACPCSGTREMSMSGLYWSESKGDILLTGETSRGSCKSSQGFLFYPISRRALRLMFRKITWLEVCLEMHIMCKITTQQQQKLTKSTKRLLYARYCVLRVLFELICLIFISLLKGCIIIIIIPLS